MSESTTPEPKRDPVIEFYRQELAESEWTFEDAYYRWLKSGNMEAMIDMLTTQQATIERLEGEKAALEATVVMASREVDDHIAALLDVRQENARLREALEKIVALGDGVTCSDPEEVRPGKTQDCGYCAVCVALAALEEGK